MSVNDDRPIVLSWLTAYAVGLACLYAVLAGILVLVFASQKVGPSAPPSVELIRMGLVGLFVGIGIALAVAPLLPRRKWVWMYGFAVIAVGVMSIVTIPFSMALFFFWIRSGARQYLESGAPHLDLP